MVEKEAGGERSDAVVKKQPSLDKALSDKTLSGAFARYNEAVRQEEREPVPEMSPEFLEKMNAYVQGVQIQNTQEERIMKRETSGKKWKKAWTALLAAAIVVGGSVCVYATVPAVRERINMLFLQKESVARLHEVPEGYTGIYTVEDLETIREDLAGRYILMNDIVIPEEAYAPGGIYENGFPPIGGTTKTYTNEEGNSFTQTYSFTGIFNGNGYTISNVRVTSGHWDSSNRSYTAGLFGTCEMQYDMLDPETGEQTQKAGGIIKNLGVVDSSVIIELDRAGDASIGMIVGSGGFVVGCYTDNVEVRFTIPEGTTVAEGSTKTISIGGVAGEAHIIDSCYSGADIVVGGQSVDGLNLYVAGVCGWGRSCVTSYFDGTIDAPVADWKSGTADWKSDTADWEVCYIDETDPPEMLNDAMMFEIAYRLLCEDYGTTFDKKEMQDCWNVATEAGEYAENALQAYAEEQCGEGKPRNFKNFLAFYCSKTNVNPQDYLTYTTTGTENTYENVYLCDPYTTPKERAVLAEILAKVFEGEEFVALCQENGVKYGNYHNYDLRREPDCDFAGFDFNYIWRMGDDGKPELRLFQWSRENGVTTYQSELADVIRK